MRLVFLVLNLEFCTILDHSCLALHNFLIKKCPTVYTPQGPWIMKMKTVKLLLVNGDNKFENLALPGMNHTKSASQMRDYLSEYVNGPGQVPWQWKVLLP